MSVIKVNNIYILEASDAINRKFRMTLAENYEK